MRVSWQQSEVDEALIAETGLPGPTVGVMGGVHGNETSGFNVVRDLMNWGLDIVCGKVILIVGNPRAIEKNVRFTEENLNRCFRSLTKEELLIPKQNRSYELNRAQDLIPYLNQMDSLLDLHEFDYSDTDPFIICERNALETARLIGAPIISFGWSKSEPGGSDGYMFEKGKEGICYELGDLNKPSPNIERGHDVVKRFLSAHGLLNTSFDPLYDSPIYVQTDYAHKRTGNSFVLGRKFKTFERLKMGELIATEDDSKIFANENDVIIFPKPDPVINTEAFTIGKIVNTEEA